MFDTIDISGCNDDNVELNTYEFLIDYMIYNYNKKIK